MNISDEPTGSVVSRRSLWLLAVPVLLVLALVGLKAPHKPLGLRQKLHEFRGDTAVDAGPNRSMALALGVRQSLLLHPRTKLSPAQSAQMVGLVNSPTNDLAQSEALDVLSLAQRAGALTAQQTQQAEDATLSVLSRNPGPMVRLESARFLGHLGSSRGVSALTALLGDSDPKVQEAARLSLTQIPN